MVLFFFSLSPTRFLTSLKFMFEHEYYTDTHVPNLCSGDSWFAANSTRMYKNVQNWFCGPGEYDNSNNTDGKHMLHRGEAAKEVCCWGWKSMHHRNKTAFLPVHSFPTLTARCSQNVCSFTSIVYSCTTACLRNTEGVIKAARQGNGTSYTALTFRDKYGLLKTAPSFINKYIFLSSLVINTYNKHHRRAHLPHPAMQ